MQGCQNSWVTKSRYNSNNNGKVSIPNLIEVSYIYLFSPSNYVVH
uniref:Uncharacterized protein n=1 Tax=Rhizophora mucronata TaxID=61149 RepID=A0A2P2PRW5_RHIMU